MGPFRSSAVKLAQVDPAIASPASVAENATPTDPVQVARAAPPPLRAKPAKPAPVAVSVAAPGSGLVAQLGAAASDASARALLASLGGRLGGRKVWVEKADVAGKTWYRAVAGGFSNSAEAGQFCAGFKSAGLSCFVRPRG